MKDINIVMDNKNNKAYINLIKERLIGNINETHKQEINSKVSFRYTKEDDLMDYKHRINNWGYLNKNK